MWDKWNVQHPRMYANSIAYKEPYKESYNVALTKSDKGPYKRPYEEPNEAAYNEPYYASYNVALHESNKGSYKEPYRLAHRSSDRISDEDAHSRANLESSVCLECG